MEKTEKRSQPNRKILTSILIFLISYLVFLVLWLQVKDYYARVVTLSASKLAAGVKGLRFEEITEGKDTFQATFSPLGYGLDLLIDIPVKTSQYTYNVPLTFAIMAALFPFMERKLQAYVEASIVLICIHLLYVFSLEAKLLTDVLVDRGIEAVNKPRIFFYEFLWSFTDNMIMRFEPFLIGFYMFTRFRK